jgi:dUTP pyrophosphatase
MNSIQLDFVKINERAVLPVKVKGNIGIDLTTIDSATLMPGERVLLRTGLAVDIPEGYGILFQDRSGNAAKRGLTILGGVIDSSYIGELKVCVTRLDFWDGQRYLFDGLREDPITIQAGERICQMVVVPDYDVKTAWVQSIHKSTDRGDKGFGSTG